MDELRTAAPIRGIELLLAHCALLEPPADERPPAAERLRDALGDDLARLLVAGLTRRRAERRPVPSVSR